MNRKQLKTLYKKEIMDVIRDKKTIFAMVVLPIILYPMLFLGIMQVMLLINSSQKERTYYIAYDNVADVHRQELNEWIAGDDDELDYVIKEVESPNPAEELEKEEIDAYLTTKVTDSQVVYEIHYLSAITNSTTVSDMLEEEIESLSKKKSEENAKAQGLDVQKILYPLDVTFKDASSTESSLGSILGSIVPFLLITSILMGAMYPAIDITAGEKERGTLETLLTLPIGNAELIVSKFLSVATVAIVSVFINVISMGGIAVYLYATMSSLSSGMGEFKVGSFVPAILITLVCVIAFALFISAVVMCICAFAKSFKEANNYTSPLTIVVILASYISFVPNIELNMKTAFIPVANICLLIKNLLIFKYDFGVIMMVLLSNVAYAFVAVWFLSKIYNSESVLFGESLSGVKLFERRKNIKKGSIPSVFESILLLIVILIVMVYVGGIISLSHPVLGGVVIPQIVMVGLPLLASIYIKADLKQVFCIKIPKIKYIIAAVLLWMGTYCVSMLISNGLTVLFPKSVESLNADFSTILEGVPFWCGLLLIAALPAVCEEMFFRGYMFTAFRQKRKIVFAIVVVSILFGAMHMSLIKLLPTAILGATLAYAVYKSGSIFVSMLIHFLNNAFSVVIMYYGTEIPVLNDETLSSEIMIVMAILAVVCLPIGIKLLQMKKITTEG